MNTLHKKMEKGQMQVFLFMIMAVAAVAIAITFINAVLPTTTTANMITRLENLGYTVLAQGGTLSSHLIPSSNNTYDLGSAERQWRDLYITGGSIHIGGTEEEASFKILIAGSGKEKPPLPEAFVNALVLKTTNVNNPYNMEVIFWDAENQRPALVLNEGAAARASMFDRSLIVGSMKGAKPLDEFYTDGTTIFPNLAFATSTQGSDLGVEHDIELLGTLYTDKISESTTGLGISIPSDLIVTGATYLERWYSQNLYRNSYVQMGSVFIQWGSDTSSIDGEEVFNFPASFPEACTSVQITRIDAGSKYELPVTSCTPGSFTIDRDDTIDGDQDFYWLAIGF